MNAIEIRDLTVRYGRRKEVLSELSLDIPVGSVTAFLGMNGAGKTTLMRALMAEIRPTSGTLSVLGEDPLRRPSAHRRRVGWVPDRTELPTWMTIADHLRLLAPFYPTWDAAEAQRLLELFELSADARYRDLSKGQRALENLVAALAHRPALLLLDEPFSGLDPSARRKVFHGVLDHLREQGSSALLVSHSVVDVERCADRVAVLHRGRVVREGDLEELRSRTARVAVALDPDTVDWVPPGAPLVERRGRDLTLLYSDFDEERLSALRAAPGVDEVELLPRDLEDVLIAATASGEAA